MMRWTALVFTAFILAGCAANYQPEVKYFDLTPKTVGAAVYWKSTDSLGFGITHKGTYLYQIDHEGNATAIGHDTASAPGPVQGIVQTGETAGATTAVAGAILPMLIPPASTTVKTSK
ncbi:MAG: hypothetical protein ABSF52_09400 [Syntrophobacteraceae bacterium]|jgi:hypothetical protein